MNRADSAAAVLAGHKMNCAQTVLTAFCEELGLELNLALKVASGFGGGMGGTGKTCGAVTGAYMVIGLKQNLNPDDINQIREKVQKLVREFNDQFVKIHGCLTCKELLGYDLSKPGEREAAIEKGLFANLCPVLIHDAVEIVEKI
jgi:C_GCAxxG_C_C family probable redox protein